MQRVRVGVVGVEVRGASRAGGAKFARQVVHVGMQGGGQRRGADEQRDEQPGEVPADKVEPGDHRSLQRSGQRVVERRRWIASRVCCAIGHGLTKRWRDSIENWPAGGTQRRSNVRSSVRSEVSLSCLPAALAGDPVSAPAARTDPPGPHRGVFTGLGEASVRCRRRGRRLGGGDRTCCAMASQCLACGVFIGRSVKRSGRSQCRGRSTHWTGEGTTLLPQVLAVDR